MPLPYLLPSLPQFRRPYFYSSCTLAVKKLLITDQSSNDCIIEDKPHPHPFKITYVDLNAGVPYLSTSKCIFLRPYVVRLVGSLVLPCKCFSGFIRFTCITHYCLFPKFMVNLYFVTTLLKK